MIHMNPPHTLSPCIFINFNIILPSLSRSSRPSVPSLFHITSLYGCLFCVTLERVAMLRLYVQYLASAGRVSIRRSFRMVRRRNAALVSKFSLEAVSCFGFFCNTDKISVALCLCSVVNICWHPPYSPICVISYILKPHFQYSQQLLVSAL